MNKNKLILNIDKNIKLIAEQNVEPYEDEMIISLNMNGKIKDLARISFEDIFDSHANRTPNKSKISIKIFANTNNEDFTDEYIINT